MNYYWLCNSRGIFFTLISVQWEQQPHHLCLQLTENASGGQPQVLFGHWNGLKCGGPEGCGVVQHRWHLASLLVLLASEHGGSSEAIIVYTIIFSHDTKPAGLLEGPMTIQCDIFLTVFLPVHGLSKNVPSFLPLELSAVTWGNLTLNTKKEDSKQCVRKFLSMYLLFPCYTKADIIFEVLWVVFLFRDIVM